MDYMKYILGGENESDIAKASKFLIRGGALGFFVIELLLGYRLELLGYSIFIWLIVIGIAFIFIEVLQTEEE